MTINDAYFAAFSLESAPTLDWPKAVLKTKVNIGTDQDPQYEKREAEIFIIDTDSDLAIQQERFLRAILEFSDACGETRLHLSTGPKLFSSFRELLASGSIRDKWDSLIQGVDQTPVNFQDRIQAFIHEFFSREDHQDQLQYMQRFRQSGNMKMSEIALRVETVNNLMAWMPGSNGQRPYPTDDSLKKYLYGVASMALQFKFRENNDAVLEDNFTLRQLKDKFRLYERNDARKRSLDRRYEQRNQKFAKRVHRAHKQSAKKPRPSAEVDKKKQGKINNPCKYHNGKHDWKYCFGNPQGPNYRPGFKLPQLNDSDKKESDAMMFDDCKPAASTVKHVDVDNIVDAAKKRKADHDHAAQVSGKWLHKGPTKAEQTWMELNVPVDQDTDDETKNDNN